MVTIMEVMYACLRWQTAPARGGDQTGAVTKKFCALTVQIICHLQYPFEETLSFKDHDCCWQTLHHLDNNDNNDTTDTHDLPQWEGQWWWEERHVTQEIKNQLIPCYKATERYCLWLRWTAHTCNIFCPDIYFFSFSKNSAIIRLSPSAPPLW